jgi:hypothetical protein
MITCKPVLAVLALLVALPVTPFVACILYGWFN